MGTEITLDLGGMTIDYAKNMRGTDHGSLFQERDRKQFRSDQIDYEYFSDAGEDPGAMELGFSRPLKDILPRLELLGFTLAEARLQYEAHAVEWKADRKALAEIVAEEISTEPLTFPEFCAFATEHAVESLDDTFVSSVNGEGEAQIRGRFFNDSTAKRVPKDLESDRLGHSERSHFGNLIDFLHPYLLMRVLAENPKNLEAKVTWQYGPLVASGWADAGDFTPCARRNETFLIATEGSSDVHVLKHAFALLKPEVADFFKFIDVSERHPFSGIGNLVKFAEGLVKIDVQNRILFLLDNDAEGHDAFQRIVALGLPRNMRAFMLPEIQQFKSFPARGPEGITNSNINKRAAAIECYLDLRLRNYPAAQVTWTNYKKDLDTYQGSLDHKESYMKHFLDQTAETLASGSYDARNIMLVLEAISEQCSSIAVER